VGYARVDITPQESVPLRGAGGDTSLRMSETVADPLYATCVAFTDESGNTILLYHLDLILSFSVPTLYARNAISKKTGVPFDQIMVTSTHNHSAPDLLNTKEASITRYTEALQNQMITAAEKALEDRKEAKMYIATAYPENLNFNRHYVLKDGTKTGWASVARPAASAGNLAGHVVKADNQMQLVKFTREGEKDILLMNWQAHPRASREDDNAIQSDVDIIRKEVEAQLNCNFAYFLGASGNLNSHSKINEEKRCKNYHENGKALAGHAVEAAANFQEVQVGKVQILGKKYPAVTKENEKVTIDLPIYAFSLGDVAFITAPYEMFCESGEAIKQGSSFKMTFVATCANSSNGYIPTYATFEYDAYEVDSTNLPGELQNCW